MEKCLNQSDRERSVYDEIFLHVFAPTITEYVEWVLQEAVESGKKRLYFLARDGWLMYISAKEIAKARDIDIELRYLKVSRYSLRCAQYGLLGESCLDIICVGGIDITFQKIMKRAALTEEEAHHIARLCGYEEKYKCTLNHIEIQRLKRELKQIKLFFQYVRKHSKECYENTIGYLKQEGLFEDIPYAIVDSGWIGTIQMSLQHLLSDAGGREKTVEGYYFGLYELPKDADYARYHGYYITPRKEIGRKVKFSICLFETIFSSPDGMTLGYEKSEEQFLPIESESKNPNACYMERNRELLLEYIRVYTAAFADLGNDRQFKTDCVEKLLKSCMGTPTKTEVEQLGSLLFCDDVLELQMQTVAAEWSMEEIKKQRFLRKLFIKLNIRKMDLHESGWPEGSIVALGGHRNKNLRQERMYKYFMYLRKAI